MITVPTVFILGAGASAAYGFPAAAQLRENIHKDLYDQDSKEFKALLDRKFKANTIIEFERSFRESGQLSVDLFLERRPELIRIGKPVIAQQLIKFEQEDVLFQPNWYTHLLNKMNCSFEDFPNNKVAFITFNYDRSLEHFFFKAIKQTYGKHPNEVADVMAKIPIIHVYGQLGLLEWQTKDTKKVRPYGDGSILKAAKGIKIVSEDTDKTKEFLAAQKYLNEARQIFFLGFGFHDENMRRLSVPFSVERFVGGTGFRLTEAEKANFINKYPGLNIGPSHLDVLGYLRDEPSFVRS